MNNNEMNNLALKFLNSIKGWIEARIDNRTQGCLRTKIAIIYGDSETNLYDAILASDYRELLEFDREHSEDPDYLEKREELLEQIVFHNLISIRPDDYSDGDYVTIGYTDNKLTNSFIICKNEKEEE